MKIDSESRDSEARLGAKIPYSRPRLVVYGNIREITQTEDGAPGMPDNPFPTFSNFKTGGSSFTGGGF